MNKQKILVVDDNTSNIRIFNELLRDDYAIRVATNGMDALEMASSAEPPDLVLLDVMMPGIDGYEVCRRLKADEKTTGIPVLFVTARGEVEEEARGFDLGAVDYITKPISPPIVKARVRNHLELKRHKDQLEGLVNARTRQLRQGYADTIHRLILASEYKDEDTGSHIRRISFYTKALAEQMGFNREFCENMEYGSSD